MKKHIWTIVASALLAAFTAYIALDTFVIPAVYDTDATEMNLALFDPSADAPASGAAQETSGETETGSSGPKDGSGSGRSSKRGSGFGKSRSSAGSGGAVSETPGGASSSDGDGNAAEYAGENTVSTENYTVTLTEYYENGTRIYVADVVLRSAQYLKTAFAENTYGRNVTQTTSAIAADNGAVLAVNGDFYGAQEKGYVIRNGVVYRDSARGDDVLCIYADGTMEIVNDREYSADELVGKGVWQAFTFGPSLVEEGEVTVGVDDEVGKAKASNPRTAIGLVDANHFVFVVSDGRTSESAGLSLYELAAFMETLGVKTAYNLDGGGSSTMYFNGSVVNNPTSGGSIRERGVSDIVYIG